LNSSVAADIVFTGDNSIILKLEITAKKTLSCPLEGKLHECRDIYMLHSLFYE
jgi:hypothetical protein